MNRKLAMVIAPFLLLAFFAPIKTQAYTWGAWSTPRYYAVSTGECQMATDANQRYMELNKYGPWKNNPSIGCRQRLRWRKAIIVGAPLPWRDQMIQIENVGPFGGYGMTLTAQTRWNTARVHSDPPVCREWALIITVTREVCRVDFNDTARLLLRMDYKASWTFLWANTQAGRGASIDISKDGWIGPVVRWP